MKRSLHKDDVKANKIIVREKRKKNFRFMIKLSKQVIYKKIEQCLISIPGDFFVTEKHVRLQVQNNN